MKYMSSQSGASLLQLLIVVGIFAVIGAVISTMLSNSFQSVRELTHVNDLRDLRSSLNLRVSCSTTKAHHPRCSSNSISLYDAQNKVIVAHSGTKIGNYDVQPMCVGNQISIVVSSLNKKAEPLYKQVPFPCRY